MEDIASEDTILAIVLIAFTLIILGILKRRGDSKVGNAPWPFYAKKPLTEPEQILYHRLMTALPRYIV